MTQIGDLPTLDTRMPMHIREIDWRIESLHDVVVAIDAGLAIICERLDQEEIDGVTACENTEPILGFGFIAAQTYALGTWTDLNKIRKSSGKPSVTKFDCYTCDPISIKGGPTRIEVINAIANYFKHHDEWSQWPTNETTRTLYPKKSS